MNKRQLARLFVLNSIAGVKNDLEFIAIFEQTVNDLASLSKSVRIT